MAISQEIIENVRQIRNAAYGKEVREAIARGLEICYGYTSGEAADVAADRANRAAAVVEESISSAAAATAAVQSALNSLESIVQVSQAQPVAEQNKIWIQPQDDTEYKVATFAAYEALWDRMNEVNAVYEQGHGGIVSIALDNNYVDPSDLLKKKYVVTYSDETSDEFFVSDGQRGAIGPTDSIESTNIYYKKVESGSFTPTPPVSYSSSLPTLNEGDYLWTITEIVYTSGAKAYLYGLSRMGINGRNGIDGSGAVHSIAIGENGEALVGHVELPVDDSPVSGSGNLLTSGGIYTALQDYAPVAGPAFTGIPTAPNPSAGDNSTQIATTKFVSDSLSTAKHKKIELILTSSSVIYGDLSITEDTYCMFPEFEGDLNVYSLAWETTAGQLRVTANAAPSSPKIITAILFNAEESND